MGLKVNYLLLVSIYMCIFHLLQVLIMFWQLKSSYKSLPRFRHRKTVNFVSTCNYSKQNEIGETSILVTLVLRVPQILLVK